MYLCSKLYALLVAFFNNKIYDYLRCCICKDGFRCRKCLCLQQMNIKSNVCIQVRQSDMAYFSAVF
jgi:hypothetical protein